MRNRKCVRNYQAHRQQVQQLQGTVCTCASSSARLEVATGMSMAVVAVFEIHIDRKAHASMKPRYNRFGSVPTFSST